MGGQGYRMKCFRFRAANCSAVPPKSLYRPSSVRATPCQLTNYGIAATGSYIPLDSLRDAPPPGEAPYHRRRYPNERQRLPV